VGLAELVRRALGAVYGTAEREDVEGILTETAGAWAHSGADGAEFVEQLRSGMAERLRHVG
jgi:hypothetical protein